MHQNYLHIFSYFVISPHFTYLMPKTVEISFIFRFVLVITENFKKVKR